MAENLTGQWRRYTATGMWAKLHQYHDQRCPERYRSFFYVASLQHSPNALEDGDYWISFAYCACRANMMAVHLRSRPATAHEMLYLSQARSESCPTT